MNKIAFYGGIWSSDYQVIIAILKKWIKTEDLKIKITIMGEEIVYEDEQIYLYCYKAIPTKLGDSFLLEGNMSGRLDDAKFFLQQLQNFCENENIPSNFDYVEVTEDGQEVSDEFSIG